MRTLCFWEPTEEVKLTAGFRVTLSQADVGQVNLCHRDDLIRLIYLKFLKPCCANLEEIPDASFHFSF